jgi:hypothetical protein
MQQERHRQRIGPVGAGSGSGLFDDPGAGSGTATVTHGPFAEVLPVAEMTISQVRNRFQDRLDIHPEALAMLDGNPADEDTRVQAGQTLMFVRPSGEKGRPCP